MVNDSVSTHDFVWTKYNNQTGFESLTYVSIIGVLMSLYGMSGYESGATMAEETQHASRAAPLGIMYAILISAITGFIFILGLLYACQNSIANALNGVSEHAVINIFNNSL